MHYERVSVFHLGAELNDQGKLNGGRENGTGATVVYLFSSKLRLRMGCSGCVLHFRSSRMNFHKIPVFVKGLQDNLEIYRIKGQKVPDSAALSLTRSSCLFRRGIYNCSKSALKLFSYMK
jgi:hypothetical protein